MACPGAPRTGLLHTEHVHFLRNLLQVYLVPLLWRTQLHRFQQSQHDAFLQKTTVALTWIAVKVEEQQHLVTLRDLVLAFDVLQQREAGLAPRVSNPESDKFKQLVADVATNYELAVFKALGFCCHVEPPHKIMSTFLGLMFYDNGSQKTPPELRQVCLVTLSCLHCC